MLRHLKKQEWTKIQTQKRDVKGLLAVATGHLEKAKILLQGENQVICLLELQQYQEAYLKAQELGFTQAIDYIAKQHP